jgi:hypothetical protein
MTSTTEHASAAPCELASQRCPLRTLMAFDFERLLEDFDEFVAALEVDAREHALSTWRSFEARLRRRLTIEEHVLLPTFAEARPVEAQLLRHEQDLLRHELSRLKSRLELHLLRAEDAGEFFRVLRRHGHRKDALYSWAQVHLSEQLRTQILETLQQSAEQGLTKASDVFVATHP